MEAGLEDDRNRLTELDENISSLQSILLTATKDLEQLEGRREVLKERKKNATQNTAQLKKNIEDAEAKLCGLQQKQQQKRNEVEIKQNAVRQLKSTLDAKKSNWNSWTERLKKQLNH